uniref:3'-5' exonuclease domain-containing protein n=1 Tax=Panagrolaimus sp. PS1159 TaxID=55785 RepID=A0AC35GI60_9BILA
MDFSRLNKAGRRRLRRDEFDERLLQAHIDGKADDLSNILTSKKLKRRYMTILDNCYKNAKSGIINGLEQKFIEKKMFENNNRAAFEQYAIDKLTNNNGGFAYKKDFINLLADDPKYAYCWAKFINLKRKKPTFLKKVKNVYKSDAEAFIRRMNGEIPTAELDKTESCEIFDKRYKIITVATPKGLKDFFRTYFVESKPKILGMDVESIPYINQISTIQLATADWCAIIDVHILSEHLSDSDWKIYFERIFDPLITRVGFAFASDYYLIGNTFPRISPLMQNERSKSLCLKKLVDSILKIPEAKDAVLHGRPLSSVSLLNVTKAILGIELDKDMQQSDWAQRPLTNEQKIYAVTDAIVVLLIKEKIENDLKKNFGPTAAFNIIEDAFVSMKAEKDATIEKLTKNLGGVSI